MKKTIFTLIIFLACTIQTTMAYEYFKVYFNNGTKSEAFYATDVDSICYSKIGLDSIVYDDWQVQEIYTLDSVYRYPLAQIDSLSFKDVGINQVAEDIDRVNGVIVPMFLQCESIGSISQHLSTICNTEGVERAWTDNQTLFVKIRDYGTISFFYPPMPFSFDEESSASRIKIAHTRSSEQTTNYTQYVNIGNAHTTIDVHNACIYYQLENNEAAIRNNAKTLSIRLNDYFKDMGISSQRITNAGPDFFVKDIFEYDVIFIITHGFYDKESNIHWLYTNNEIFSCSDDEYQYYKNGILNELDNYYTYSPDKWQYNWIKEFRNGRWCAICYLCVSDKLIASSKNSFNNHKAIIFNVACESLRGNDNMANAFINKGAICYLGYTDTNRTGHAGGYEFFSSLMNGSCIGQAYESITNSFKEEVFSEDGETYSPVLKMIKANDRVNDVSKICITHSETLSTEDIPSDNVTSVRLIGRIKKLKSNYLADNYEYGFQLSTSSDMSGVKDIEADTRTYDEATLYMNWEATLAKKDLQPNTTYYYRAYMNDGPSNCYGEIMQFTVEDNRIPYGVITENGTHLTFYYDENKNEHVEETVIVSPGTPTITNKCHDIREVTFDASFHNYEPTSTKLWFSNMDCLTTITNLQYLNTTKVTNMDWMFGGCSSLTNLDLDSLNTANVTSMYEMFSNCKSLTNLDLSKFNTVNVTTMWGMFRNCSSLSTLDISNFNTENVINISYMFADCGSLKSINVSGLNTNNLTFMGHVFEGCISLKNLDLSSFNTTKVTGMAHMFNGCRSLTTIDLSSFNTDNVTDMSYMFSGCSSLETIYAGNWKPTSGYDNGSMMFSGCEKLTGGNGTKIGNNLYGYDNVGNPLYYYCPDNRSAAHIDGGKDSPGLFTAK